MKPALFIVHWPGKDTPACEEHALKLVQLGKVMGFAVTSTLCEPQICTNCENEAKQKERA